MERLWAPWRMRYIQGPRGDACIFCTMLQAGKDAEHYILHRSRHAYAILNLYPYTSGHLMVVPNAHKASYLELDDEELWDVIRVLKLATRALTKAMSPDGFNVGMNLGKSAGAGISGHLHVHVVPRWVGDTDLMPVLADTRVMPEDLRTTYEKLREHFHTPAP